PVELQLFSPLAGPFPADPTIAVRAATPQAIAEASESLDAFVIGGGDLISFRPQIARVYDEHFDGPLSAHAACWALPAIHARRRLPIVWNAPGVPYDFDGVQPLLVRAICERVDYLAVRDQTSRARLASAGVDAQVQVVPDSAVLLAKHFPEA